MKLGYKIIDVRTTDRKPGFIYATIVDAQGAICVNATFDYCVDWIKREMAKEKSKAETSKSLSALVVHAG
jgi:hypothetical protein